MKQYRVIKRTELVSSFIIEVDGSEDLDTILDSGEWEKRVIYCNYEDDVTDSYVCEAWSQLKPASAAQQSTGYAFENDGLLVYENG